MRTWSTLVLLGLPLLAVDAFFPITPKHATNSLIQQQQQQMGRRGTTKVYMSDNSWPSDTASDRDDDEEEEGTKTASMPNNAEMRGPLKESLKCQIYKIAAKTNRGQLANLDQQNEVINLVAQLESMGGRFEAIDLEGRWELVYSDVQPFRVSPFFMTVGKLMGNAGQSPEDFFRLHRLATSGSEIGHVRQIITSTELVSEVEIITGIPSIPFAIKGTVITRASAERTAEGPLRLNVKSTGVTDSSLFGFLNGGTLPELPIGDVAAQLGAYPPAVMMSTYYADASMRISRTEDDHFFVFNRMI